ncbi:MAG: glycoside hydrolase family 26 protein [bacterium]
MIAGVYSEGMAQDIQRYDDLCDLIGFAPGIVHWYQPWGESGYSQTAVDNAALNNVSRRGAAPMITWEAWGAIGGDDPCVLRDIAAGRLDAHIDEWAQCLRDFGKPVFLRLFHEMNNPRYTWAVGQNGNTAGECIAAWRYIYDRFANAGAANVLWVWSPNAENDSIAFKDIYPGDDYVDWLGVDGYNGGSDLDWGGWRSPLECFRRSLDAFASISSTKPVMISETSSVENGGDKAEWIRNLFELPRDYQSIKAIVWFHEDFSNKGEADWRIDTSEAALAAFRETAQDGGTRWVTPW